MTSLDVYKAFPTGNGGDFKTFSQSGQTYRMPPSLVAKIT